MRQRFVRAGVVDHDDLVGQSTLERERLEAAAQQRAAVPVHDQHCDLHGAINFRERFTEEATIKCVILPTKPRPETRIPRSAAKRDALVSCAHITSWAATRPRGVAGISVAQWPRMAKFFKVHVLVLTAVLLSWSSVAAAGSVTLAWDPITDGTRGGLQRLLGHPAGGPPERRAGRERDQPTPSTVSPMAPPTTSSSAPTTRRE